MIYCETVLIVHNAFDVINLLHVALAAEKVVAHVRDLLNTTILVVFQSLREVSIKLKSVGMRDKVAVFLCKLTKNVDLDTTLVVVRINKHELVVIRNVEVLVGLEVLL